MTYGEDSIGNIYKNFMKTPSYFDDNFISQFYRFGDLEGQYSVSYTELLVMCSEELCAERALIHILQAGRYN